MHDVSFPEGDIESTSSACLKNSSFRRWKRTSTLLTAKDMLFNVNRHGFGSRRMRCGSDSISVSSILKLDEDLKTLQGRPEIQD